MAIVIFSKMIFSIFLKPVIQKSSTVVQKRKVIFVFSKVWSQTIIKSELFHDFQTKENNPAENELSRKHLSLRKDDRKLDSCVQVSNFRKVLLSWAERRVANVDLHWARFVEFEGFECAWKGSVTSERTWQIGRKFLRSLLLNFSCNYEVTNATIKWTLALEKTDKRMIKQRKMKNILEVGHLFDKRLITEKAAYLVNWKNHKEYKVLYK